jgi:hypothetical protein
MLRSTVSRFFLTERNRNESTNSTLIRIFFLHKGARKEFS